MSDSKKIHEKFHNNTRSQLKIINEGNFTYKLILSIINKYLKKNQVVLDVGCGAGTLCMYIAARGNKILGIDISRNAIKSCKESAQNLCLDNAQFKVMDFPKETLKEKFDFIIFTEVMEHIEDDIEALKKINSLLKKNGTVFITTPSKNAPLYKLGLLEKFDREVGHIRRYTMQEVIDLCREANLEIIETKKNEGIIRNFLFTNPFAGKLVRFIKYSLSDLVTLLDNFSLKLFGESDLFIIARKP